MVLVISNKMILVSLVICVREMCLLSSKTSAIDDIRPVAINCPLALRKDLQNVMLKNYDFVISSAFCWMPMGSHISLLGVSRTS